MSPSRERTPGTRRSLTRGALAASAFVVLLEYAFGLTFRYLFPSVPIATLDELYWVTFAIAVVGGLAIYRYLPDSKKPAF